MPLFVQRLTLGPPSRRFCEDLSFALAPGETAAIVGPSNSGKSSLLLCAAGQLKPAAGRVGIGPDADSARPPGWREVGLGPIPVLAPLFDTLTVQEHLTFQARLYRVPAVRQRVADELRRFGLEAAARRRIKDLDAFTALRAALAITCVHRPQFVLLDEPDQGLSVEQWSQTAALLRKIAAEGVGVLYTTVDSVHAAVADVVVDIAKGEVHRGEPVGRDSR